MNLRLRELRESQGISVATMIERLGVKDSRYRKWESQAAAMPLEYAMRCCSILHCTHHFGLCAWILSCLSCMS